MVRPVLPTLLVDKTPTPTMNDASFRSPTFCILSLSPRPSQAFRHSPPATAHSAEAALHLDLRSSWSSSRLHPLSPSTATTHRCPSPRAAGSRHDQNMLQAAFSVPNFYEVLGLADDVAIPDIKAAYRQMARKYHPDVCAGAEVEESTRRFMAVQEAYETLSDPARRASYDRTMASLSSGAAAGAGAASRWGCASSKEDQTHWKPNWEDQLFNMRQKGAAKAAQNPDSWGARMRKQWQEQQRQEDHEYAGS